MKCDDAHLAPLEAEDRFAPGGYWDQRIRIIFLETVANILRNHRDKLDAVVEAVSMIGDRRRPYGDDVLLSNDDQYLLVQLCTPLVGLSDELAAFCEERAAEA